jgi:hypothetical protein
MIEWILNKLFRRIDIMGREDGEIYLRRWFIYPRYKEFKKLEPRVYLHKFYNGYHDRHLHDHPWSFSSLILKGGYWEHSFNPEWKKWETHMKQENEPEKTRKKWYGPGSLLRRGARWTHSVELPTKKGKTVPCWTLIWTGVKERSWGFHTDSGWCKHDKYEHGICWCYEETAP